MTKEQLIDLAFRIANPKDSGNGCSSGSVGSVLQTKSGGIYRGVCIDCACGIGFCAEHSAIAAMLTAGESEIVAIVAINTQGKIYPPCGRCRELMYQVDKTNLKTTIILSKAETITLLELLPHRWQENL